MKYKYQARLTQDMVNDRFPRYIAVPSIVDATGGFWVDGDLKFTRENEFARVNDALTFIMPSQIMFITKVDVYDE